MLKLTHGSMVLALLAAGNAAAQSTTRVSVDSVGAEGVAESLTPSMSSDGRYVAFQSYAANLIANDTNGQADIFVHDRSTGVTERVSVDSSGAESNDGSFGPSISPDGRFVAFHSYASNLVSGDTNGKYDVFVHDRVTGITERVSVDSTGSEANDQSFISAFGSALSSDGRFVAFESDATNLVGGDANHQQDIFVHDRVTGVTERVSVDSSGGEGNGASGSGAVSGDGGLVVFASAATNLVPGDSNGYSDIFVHDLSSGTTQRVSVRSDGGESDGVSYEPTISADGRVMSFGSFADNLVPGDTNGCGDIFVNDLSTGSTERVSIDSAGIQGDFVSYSSSISADGEVIAFESRATNLDGSDPYGFSDIYVHDRSSGTTYAASVDSAGVRGNSDSFNPPRISADGLTVAFESDASNLVSADTNGAYDIFVHERCMVDASWSNYGQGYPGSNGVPGFTSQGDPVLGGGVALDIGNSSGTFGAGLVILGFQQASIHSSLGGDLLVLPFNAFLVGLAPSGATLSGSLPFDDIFCGVEVDLQVLESDPGASKGVSFTPGLQLILGH